MTRVEIGSFLGLKLKTVSRVLSRFAKEGLIAKSTNGVFASSMLTDCA